MRVPRIHVGSPVNSAGVLTLDASAAHYLSQVLRLRRGDAVRAFDGRGGEWQAEIARLDKKSVQLELLTFLPVNRSSPIDIHLGIGWSRGERMDWIVQKATELGVAAITPLLTQRCEVKLQGARLAKRLQHWRAVSINACQQCGLNVVPQLHEPVDGLHWARQNSADRKLVLHPEADQKLLTGSTPKSVLLATGPEGGFTDQEVEQLNTAGFTALCLGKRVLRTETAPLAALTLLQHLWGDLNC